MADSAAYPRDLARVGICDVCERDDKPVVAFKAEDPTAACEECFTAMSEAWDALTPEDQEEVLRDAAA